MSTIATASSYSKARTQAAFCDSNNPRSSERDREKEFYSMKNSGLKTSSEKELIKHKTIPLRARKLATEAIGIDSHIDTVQRVLVMGEDLGKRWDVGHVDIPRLREGGTHAPFFALWVPVYFPGAEA